ncbi:MAG: RsmB/NOP family class I SAM-dependent RNA methyltransferase [Rhodothermales bacterium]|nr:RsmB/NOP family class I SAM-dependent RNA methyltransferase [Rhodothermales bacterium]
MEVRPFALYATVELYDRIVASPYPADRLMQTFFKERKQLGKRDRGFIAETVYGMLRNRRWLEWAFPDLDTMHRALAHLAIHQPDAALPLEPADDAQLRRAVAAAREKPLPESPVESLGLTYSMPDWMVATWLDLHGPADTEALCAALNRPAPLVIRVNTLKTTREALRQTLADAGHASEPTPASPDGLILATKANLFSLPAFHEGHFEIQDEGSQLLSYLLNARPGQQVIDGCAGGGGKTLHLAALMQNKGVLYAFDVAHRRLEESKPRIRRAGASNIRLRPIDTNRSRDVTRLHGKADAVLIDSPCSGSGVLRRNPDATWKLSEEGLAGLNREQRDILEAYTPLVKPGGRLVYATCSLFPQENERIVEEFLTVHPEMRLVPAGEALAAQGLTVPDQTDAYLRLMPHRHGTDGFFGAVMERI